MIKHSAGILISAEVDGELRYLFVHPTNASWYGTYSIPKGEYTDEYPLTAALREVQEEVGLAFKDLEIDKKEPEIVKYKNKKGKVYKTVTVYFLRTDFSKIKDKFNKDLSIKIENLQLEEVNWAGFLTLGKLESRIFYRFKHLLF